MEHELNARPLSYKEIGEKFIVHPSFKDLLKINNTVVIGPRGSGKTTMLKMLTPEAQEHWKPSTNFNHLKKELFFYGIYIPMSRIFQEELDSRIQECNLSDTQKENLLDKLYYLNVVESIVELVDYFFQKDSFTKNEIQDSLQLICNEIEINTDYCYKTSTLNKIIASEKKKTKQSISNSSYNEETSYSDNLISLVDPILKSINEVFEFPQSTKFALCFDELDVYPSKYSRQLIRNLRGINPTVLLKLTIAPVHQIRLNTLSDGPQLIHDYDKIYLWPNLESSANTNFSNSEFLRFSEELAEQTLFQITGRQISLLKLLGEFSYRKVFNYMKTSESDDNPFKAILLENFSDDDLDNYVFLQLVKRSANFESFITERNNLKIHNLKKSSRKISSSLLRKIKQIVFNRIIVTKKIENKVSMRNQKIPVQYHGRDMLLKILDGNPRYLKKFIEFLSESVVFEGRDYFEIPIQKQASSLQRVKDLFLERVKALPTSNSKYYNTGKLIDDIGKYLRYNINIDDTWNTTGFKSYIKVSNFQELTLFEKFFEQAIKNGALMVIGDVDIEKLSTVRNKELRLNYLLHVEYKLPIRKYYKAKFQDTIKSLPNSLIRNVGNIRS